MGPQHRGRFLQTGYPRVYEGKGAAGTASYVTRARANFCKCGFVMKIVGRVALGSYTGIAVSQLLKGQNWRFIYFNCWRK